MEEKEQIIKYNTELFQKELGNLDDDDLEVLEATIRFDIASRQLRRLC